MNNITFDFSEKVVLITGGRRGLGRDTAIALAKAGANIAVLAKSPNDLELEEVIRSYNVDYYYMQRNLHSFLGRTQIIQDVIDRFGKIDILINNAGYQHRTPILDYTLEQWDDDIELLLSSVFELSRYAAAFMMEHGGGKIIHISSISGFQGARNIIGYSTMKHGLIGMTKCMSNEWAQYNINVNAVAPGIIQTEMIEHIDQDKIKEITGRIPVGRLATTNDIVPAILFLASQEASFINGETLLVDGGWMGR